MFKTDALAGKTFLIAGIANTNSIAYPIARLLRSCGAEIVLMSHEMNRRRVVTITEELRAAAYYCDVSDEDDLSRCMNEIRSHGKFDGFLHSIAFSDRNELKGRFINTSRKNFRQTMDISCFSLIDITGRMLDMDMFSEDASLLTLSFDASHGPYPNYNVMAPAKAALEATVRGLAFDLGQEGIRVNAIAASPENTLSARGIGNFRLIGDYAEAMSPLGRRATLEEIANTALFLLTALGSGVNGQIVFVDGGSSVPNMPPARNAAAMATCMGKIAEVHTAEASGD